MLKLIMIYINEFKKENKCVLTSQEYDSIFVLYVHLYYMYYISISHVYMYI